MAQGVISKLDSKKRYLQVALNSTPSEGENIIRSLPSSNRILIEAGTPLIKAYGIDGIRRLKNAWQLKTHEDFEAYVVADTKCMDRGRTLDCNLLPVSF